MADAGFATLVIEGEGGYNVEQVSRFLLALDRAYNSLLVLENVVLSPHDLAHTQWFPQLTEHSSAAQRVHVLSEVSSSLLFPAEMTDLIRPRDRLVLRAVHLESPGWWKVIGQLNPLETIRKYLKDQHERRKDRQYREPAEARKLELQNKLLQLDWIDKALTVAHKHGATDKEMATLRQNLIYQPLAQLDVFQDEGLISTATIVDAEPGERSNG